MKLFAALPTILLLHLMLADSLSTNSTCRIIWIFKEPCTKPNEALVRQVASWGSKNCSDDQEMCMYEIIRSNLSNLSVKHTSMNPRKTTAMSFDFYPPEIPQFCKIMGYAETTPTNGTGPNEFCLFHNLFKASGVTKDPGFKEISNERMCPSKKTAKCQ